MGLLSLYRMAEKSDLIAYWAAIRPMDGALYFFHLYILALKAMQLMLLAGILFIMDF